MTSTATQPARSATTPGGGTDERVARLRELSAGDPEAARREAWAWIVEAGARVPKDRGGALHELGELFRTGRPSEGIEGRTQGTLVSFTVHPVVDTALAAITTAWLPWAGKRFDSAAAKGDNLLLKSARWPSKLLWPLYSMRDAGDRLGAFDFETRVEAGALDPDRQVLVIDYAPIEANPRLVIRSIRDELVEIVPGAHLGKMIWVQGDRQFLSAYFALTQPQEDEVAKP